MAGFCSLLGLSGYYFLLFPSVVLSHSMRPALNKGDLIIVKTQTAALRNDVILAKVSFNFFLSNARLLRHPKHLFSDAGPRHGLLPSRR